MQSSLSHSRILPHCGLCGKITHMPSHVWLGQKARQRLRTYKTSTILCLSCYSKYRFHGGQTFGDSNGRKSNRFGTPHIGKKNFKPTDLKAFSVSKEYVEKQR